MKRPEVTHTHPRNSAASVPELQGKAKRTKEKARPIIAGTTSSVQRVFHTDVPISNAYGPIDNDLAMENLENDLTAADKQDIM